MKKFDHYFSHFLKLKRLVQKSLTIVTVLGDFLKYWELSILFMQMHIFIYRLIFPGILPGRLELKITGAGIPFERINWTKLINFSLYSWRSCKKAENLISGDSISGTMLDEFKRKDWGEEKIEEEGVGRTEKTFPPLPHHLFPPSPHTFFLSLPSLSFSMHPTWHQIKYNP